MSFMVGSLCPVRWQVIWSDLRDVDASLGPNSYLSICTDPGVEWIASRIGASDYATCATSLASMISRKLRLHEPLSQKRVPDPPENTAWLYTKGESTGIFVCVSLILIVDRIAYFKESIEATYYTIDATAFEKRLRQHYTGSHTTGDSGWYALRNMVFASGCRIEEFKNCSWTEAQSRARVYFDNALSVEADLLHHTPRLVAIQALIAMVCLLNDSGYQAAHSIGPLCRRFGKPKS